MTLAKITFTNAKKWALAHNKLRDPDSIPMDLADYYNHDEREMNRMMQSSGPERRYMVDQANSSGGGGEDEEEGKDDEGKDDEGNDADIY